MTKAPDLRETFLPPEEIVQAGLDGDLVLFVGAGVSRRLDLPTWNGLASKVLEDLRDSGQLNYSELKQLSTLNAKQQLSIAHIIAEENGHDLNIRQYLTGKSEGNSIYKAINDIGCPCVTTNYDELLSPRYTKTADGSATPASVNRVSDKEKFFAKLLNEPGTVIHLHGAISDKETMVVTTSDYLRHYDHENVQTFLGELFAKKVVLFLGYGLEETEILEHILRRGNVNPTGDRRRFALQGFFRNQKPLYENLHSYYEKSFGVHLLGFMRDHDDYKVLDDIVKSWSSKLVIKEPELTTDVEFMNEVLASD